MTATTTDPLQEVVGCLEQLRESIPRLGDREVGQQIRAVESLSRQVHAVGLEPVAQLQARNARRWACEAKIILVVCGGKGEPLDVGRAMRTVPAGIRRALVVRDKGCAFPGCGRPPSRCSAHHRKHWVDGGETSVDNCCLLCGYHHRMVHNTGWEITIHPDRVEFIPPAVINPRRRPLYNPLHR